jgi:acyl-CoA reductase-like NAD-dependent aldehyde dehydrogenase
MIAESEVTRVHEWVEEAVAGGAELLTRGAVNSKFQKPNSKQIQNPNQQTTQALNPQIPKSSNLPILQSSYRPTVLFSPSPHSLVSREEVFGPVVCVYPYSDLKDAISGANSLRYAFQAAVFTKDIDTALETAQKLNASAVMINDNTAFRVDWMPFGGRDESGIGTGGIPYSMKEMTREKLIVMKSGGLL